MYTSELGSRIRTRKKQQRQLRARFKKRIVKARKKNRKKLRVKKWNECVSCKLSAYKKKQTNKRINFAKDSFYIRVSQGCLTEKKILSSIQKIVKAAWYLALHSSKTIKFQIQANMSRFSLCRFYKISTSHNIHPKSEQSVCFDSHEID